MSKPVELSALRARLGEYGPGAFLVTVSDDGSPHVVSVEVRGDGDRLLSSVGRSTRANLGERPAATLLWPPGPDPAYSMIVDVAFDAAVGDDGVVAMKPTSAILHRVAGSPGDGPTCKVLTDP